jgi:hypothetical protein
MTDIVEKRSGIDDTMHGVPLYPEVNDPPHQCRVSSGQKIVHILRTWCEAQETMKISNAVCGVLLDHRVHRGIPGSVTI